MGAKRRQLRRPRFQGSRGRIGRIREQKEPVPDPIEHNERVIHWDNAETFTLSLEQSETLELSQRIVDLEIDVDTKGGGQPFLYARVQRFLIWWIACHKKKIVREEGLFAFLFLGCADNIVEDPGVIADIAEIDVIGDLLLVLER